VFIEAEEEQEEEGHPEEAGAEVGECQRDMGYTYPLRFTF